MFRTDEDYLMDKLIGRASIALGLPTEVIRHSERFEQSVYDFAKAALNLPTADFTNNASFHMTASLDRFEIVYRDQDPKGKQLAEFYNKLCPESFPTYLYGLEAGISFLIHPFIQKILPAIQAWRLRPSCINDNSLHYVDRYSGILKSNLDPGFGNAVYVTGADPSIGNWEQAIRMTYSEKNKCWELPLPHGLIFTEFKFLTGSYDLGSIANTSQLNYEAGENKVLIVHDGITNERPLQNKPSSVGIKC